LRKRTIMIALILGLLTIGPGTGARSAELANNYGFEKGLRLARILDRQFVFSFTSSGCPHCQDFKDNILSNRTVKNILQDHFILSLVSLDSTVEIELPEQGKLTNVELASSLGVEGTPTTYFFYPPDPGLSGNGIVRIPGNVPNPEDMVNLMERVLTESFQEGEDGNGPSYNYKNPVKEITKSDFDFLKENVKFLPVVVEQVEPSALPGGKEIILNLDSREGESYANRLLEETPVKKVYLVSDA